MKMWMVVRTVAEYGPSGPWSHLVLSLTVGVVVGRMNVYDDDGGGDPFSLPPKLMILELVDQRYLIV